jgi:PAS domain S-box-containing protein
MHPYLFILAADVVPDWLEDFGGELANAWPIIIALMTLGVVLRYVMRNAIRDQLDPIKQQFQNNGGSSMRDAVDKLAGDTAELKQSFADRSTQLEEIRADYQSSMKHIRDKIDFIFDAVIKNKAVVDALTASDPQLAWFELDSKADVVYVNDAYLKLFGIAYHEAMENKWVEFVNQDDLMGLLEATHAAVTNKTGFYYRFRVHDRSGKEKAVVARSTPIVENGELKGFVGALTQVA